MTGLNGLWLLFTYFANSDAGQWLPISPVQRYISSWSGIDVIRSYLKYVNWFIPVSTILNILSIWLAAIAVFYTVMAILRWVKVVGD